jgi:hypothetical protein
VRDSARERETGERFMRREEGEHRARWGGEECLTACAGRERDGEGKSV